MNGNIPEELGRAIMREHEHEARRLARHATRRRSGGRSLRTFLAQKLVQAGLKIDKPAGVAVIKSAAKAGYYLDQRSRSW